MFLETKNFISREKKQSNDEFLLECIRQNDEDLRDTKMEEELEERIFQKMVENYFYDDEKQNLIEENYYINIIKGEVDL